MCRLSSSMDNNSDSDHAMENRSEDSSDMDAEDDIYSVDFKKFLLNKEVLDTMRLYLDPTETTVNRLQRAGVITLQERDKISSLRHPMNRNELMQAAIRKSWTPELFTAFTEILKYTQNPRLAQTLGILLRKGVKKFSEDVEEDHPSKSIFHRGSFQSTLKKLSTSSNLDERSKVLVQSLLQEREEVIARSKLDMAALQAKLQDLENANLFLQGQMARLESAVADVVCAVVPEGLYPNSEEGLQAVMREVRKLWAGVKEDQALIGTLQEDKQRWTKVNFLLNRENDELKKARGDLQLRFKDLEERTTEEIDSLERSLQQERQTVLTCSSNLATTEREKEVVEATLVETRRQLAALASNLRAVTLSRDETVRELAEADVRTRKLLKSLGLGNNVRQLGQAVDHARNILFVRNRRTPGRRPVHISEVEEAPMDADDDEEEEEAAGGESAPQQDNQQVINLSLNTSGITAGQPRPRDTAGGVQRRTSMLGLNRATTLPAVQPSFSPSNKEEGVAAKQQPPQQSAGRNGPVMLPDIRRRCSVAWRLKTDLCIGNEIEAPLVEDVTVDNHKQTRRRSVLIKTLAQ